MARYRSHADEVRRQFRRACIEAVTDAGEYVGEASTRTAPIEEGTLVGSMFVDVDERNLVAAVSYDTPYARRQHEDTRLRHDAGRRAKWLELTLREEARDVERIMFAPLRRFFGR